MSRERYLASAVGGKSGDCGGKGDAPEWWVGETERKIGRRLALKFKYHGRGRAVSALRSVEHAGPI